MKFFCFFFLSDDYVNQYASSVPKKTDEQSALNRILHETAAWVFVYFFRFIYLCYLFYSYFIQ